MKKGTKSLLFGVHNIVWHPITVWLGWLALYGKRPTLKQTVAIFCHDLGYWGCENMDDAYGEGHPVRSARIIFLLGKWIGRPEWFQEPFEEVLLHSRYLCAKLGREPSRLCFADKLSMAFDPKWFYILRARLSGELKEYKANSGQVFTDGEWFDWVQRKCILVAINRTPGKVRNHEKS